VLGKGFINKHELFQTYSSALNIDPNVLFLLHREPPMFDEIRPEYNRYLNILLKRPPSEWQEALRTTDLREPARVQGKVLQLSESTSVTI